MNYASSLVLRALTECNHASLHFDGGRVGHFNSVSTLGYLRVFVFYVDFGLFTDIGQFMK